MDLPAPKLSQQLLHPAIHTPIFEIDVGLEPGGGGSRRNFELTSARWSQGRKRPSSLVRVMNRIHDFASDVEKRVPVSTLNPEARYLIRFTWPIIVSLLVPEF